MAEIYELEGNFGAGYGQGCCMEKKLNKSLA